MCLQARPPVRCLHHPSTQAAPCATPNQGDCVLSCRLYRCCACATASALHCACRSTHCCERPRLLHAAHCTPCRAVVCEPAAGGAGPSSSRNASSLLQQLLEENKEELMRRLPSRGVLAQQLAEVVPEGEALEAALEAAVNAALEREVRGRVCCRRTHIACTHVMLERAKHACTHRHAPSFATRTHSHGAPLCGRLCCALCSGAQPGCHPAPGA